MYIDYNKFRLDKKYFYNRNRGDSIYGQRQEMDSSDKFKCLKCGNIIPSLTCNNCDHSKFDYYIDFGYNDSGLTIVRSINIVCNNCSRISKYWTCNCGCENNFRDSSYHLVDIEEAKEKHRLYEEEKAKEEKEEKNRNNSIIWGWIIGIIILILTFKACCNGCN